MEKIVLEVAPRLAFDALARAVVTDDLEHVAVIAQLVKEDAHRGGHGII
jgi:hypothetical protein